MVPNISQHRLLAATLIAHKTFDAAGQPLLDTHMPNAVLIVVLVMAILRRS